MGYYENSDAIIEICDICPNTDKNISGCKNCYGKIVSVKYDFFDVKTKNFITKTISAKDYFETKNGLIVENLNATELEKKCIIIGEIIKNKSNSSLPTFLWSAYDRPTTYKTDCIKCKKVYNNIPPCQQTEENINKGLPKHYCGRQKQKRVKF